MSKELGRRTDISMETTRPANVKAPVTNKATSFSLFDGCASNKSAAANSYGSVVMASEIGAAATAGSSISCTMGSGTAVC